MYTINIAVNFIPIMMFNRKYFGIYYLVGDIRSDKWSFMHEENMGMFLSCITLFYSDTNLITCGPKTLK